MRHQPREPRGPIETCLLRVSLRGSFSMPPAARTARPYAQAEIERRKRRYPGIGTRPLPSGSAESGSEVRGDVPSVGEVVVATLLEERTRKDGWKAEHEPSGLQGPIQNTGDVPDAAKAGDRVNLKVRYATPRCLGCRKGRGKKKTTTRLKTEQ